MPPSGFKKKAVEGALKFAEAIYQDLLEEVRSGKYPSYEAAIEHELSLIKTALERAHITPNGDLVER